MIIDLLSKLKFAGDIRPYIDFYEPFSGTYLNRKSYRGNLSIKFHSIELFESEYWSLDEMRLYIPMAKILRIESIDEGFYWYYILTYIEGKLLTLFSKGTLNLSSRSSGGSQFLIFHDETEKIEFNKYLEQNNSLIKIQLRIMMHVRQESIN